VCVCECECVSMCVSRCVSVCVSVCVCEDKVTPSSPIRNPYTHLRLTHLELRRIKRITKHLCAQIVCTCQK